MEKNVNLFPIDMLSSKKMFRLAFNTHLVYKNKLVFEKNMMDPDKTIKKIQFPEKFKVVLLFDTTEVDPSSEEGAAQLEGLEVIKNIVAEREEEEISELDSQVLTFGDPDFDDRDEMMVNHPGDSDASDHSEGEDEF